MVFGSRGAETPAGSVSWVSRRSWVSSRHVGNVGLWLAQGWQNAEAREKCIPASNVASLRLVIPFEGETEIC